MEIKELENRIINRKKGEQTMTLDEYEQLLRKIAKDNGLELTENAYRIARFRERTQLPMDKCPCSPMILNAFVLAKSVWMILLSLVSATANVLKERGIKWG